MCTANMWDSALGLLTRLVLTCPEHTNLYFFETQESCNTLMLHFLVVGEDMT